MKRRAGFILLWAVVGLVPWAAKAEPRPRIVFEDRIFDFGVLLQGATAQNSFVFRNAGKAPLEIRSVTSSCGCTAALPDQKTVPPGGKSAIRVQYDSRGKVGEVHKTVRVQSNDPEERVVHLVVRGMVAPSEHMDRTGAQNLFTGSCRTCHVDQGRGKKGGDLYRADCAMCHEHHKMGGKFIAPAAEDMAGLPARELRRVISEGRDGTSMPAYHKARGGPLTEKDISSLVKHILGLKRKAGEGPENQKGANE